MAAKRYFSLPAAARELGVSADVLRQQFRFGLIPAIKTPGGQSRFTAETIEWIKENGWPRKPGSKNEIENIQRLSPQPSREAGVEDEFPDSINDPRIDEEGPNFRTVRNAGVCLREESDRDWEQADPFHFRRKWIDYASRLLPIWLTAEQEAHVSEKIATGINERTPQDEPRMPAICEEIVRSALLPINRQRAMAQAQDTALGRIRARIPTDATPNEITHIEARARNAMRRAGEGVDGETLFAVAWQEIAPGLAAIELRRQRESLRTWALQKLPFRANEKEQREFRAAMSRVIEQMTGECDAREVRDQLETALEPVVAAIAKRVDDEHRSDRIRNLLCSAKLQISSYLQTLYNQGELEREAIVDWEWREDLEKIVVEELQGSLSGDETSEQLRKSVEYIVDDELEPDDEEDE